MKMRQNAKIVMLIVWVIVIFILTGYPSLEEPEIKEFPIDKIYHFVLFFIFAVLSTRVFKVLVSSLLGTGVVIMAEVQQLYIRGRTFELLDILAGFLGLAVIHLIIIIRRKRKHDIPET